MMNNILENTDLLNKIISYQTGKCYYKTQFDKVLLELRMKSLFMCVICKEFILNSVHLYVYGNFAKLFFNRQRRICVKCIKHFYFI